MLEKQFREIIKSSGISDFMANTFYEFLEKDVQIEKEEIGIELKKTTDEFTVIEQKLDRLLEAYLETLVEGENYKQKKNELVEKQIIMKEKIIRLKAGNPIWIERVKEFIKDAQECEKIARAENNGHLLAQMAKKVGSKYFLKDQKIEFSLLPPFQALAASPLAASATLDSSRIFPYR